MYDVARGRGRGIEWFLVGLAFLVDIDVLRRRSVGATSGRVGGSKLRH